MSEIKFANGIYFNRPHEKAPEFVLGSISIKPDDFIGWLREQDVNVKGYVRLKVNLSKAGKEYVALDDWKPDPGSQRGVIPDEPKEKEDDFDDDIPF